MATITNYEDLTVYQRAFDLQQRMFQITKSFPREERYSLTDQVRRSSRSIGANIAEAWQKRRYPAHFASKLSDSDSEQAETKHWIKTAYACEYITIEQRNDLINNCKEVGAMLGKMITNAASWSTN